MQPGTYQMLHWMLFTLKIHYATWLRKGWVHNVHTSNGSTYPPLCSTQTLLVFHHSKSRGLDQQWSPRAQYIWTLFPFFSIAKKVLLEVETEDLLDQSLWQTFPAHCHSALGHSRHVQHPSLPSHWCHSSPESPRHLVTVIWRNYKIPHQPTLNYLELCESFL